MSLYRTYRPKVLADVIGQDHIVTTLERALAEDRLSHAYLFSGPRGTGKTSVARIVARVLLTHKAAPDLAAQILKGIDDGNLVDLIEIDAASNRRIDDVRALLEGIQFPPVAAAAKVYIIDEVHMLTKEAFNALLKTLEEPPPYAYFILATTELHKVPLTIQSRCQRFQFRQIREEDIIRRLQAVADLEHITVERPALRAIAHAARGGMRDALALLDQLRSLEHIRPEDIAERIGESGFAQAEALLAALDAGDGATVLAITTELDQLAVPPENILRLMLDQLRARLPDVLQDPVAAGLLVARLDAILSCLRELRTSPVPNIALEAGLLRAAGLGVAPSPTPAAPKPASQAPAPAIPKERPTPKVTVPEPAPVAKEPTETPTPAATIEATALTLESLKAAWPTISTKAEPSSVRMSLKDGRLTGLDGNAVTLTFSSNFHRDKVAATEASRAVEALLQQTFHTPVRLQCVVDGSTTGLTDREIVNVAAMAAEIF